MRALWSASARSTKVVESVFHDAVRDASTDENQGGEDRDEDEGCHIVPLTLDVVHEVPEA